MVTMIRWGGHKVGGAGRSRDTMYQRSLRVGPCQGLLYREGVLLDSLEPLSHRIVVPYLESE